MIKNIEYTTMHGISVNVALHDQITVIGGDSSVGKTFLKDTIQEYCNGIDKLLVEVFDYKRPIDIGVLKAMRNKLIIIDNADILLDGNKDICAYINTDKHNQYLLFMRSENDIDVSVENYAELKRDGKRLFAAYDYR